jgi:hypothetical protein
VSPLWSRHEQEHFAGHSFVHAAGNLIWIPKYRRKVVYGELRRHLGEVFRSGSWPCRRKARLWKATSCLTTFTRAGHAQPLPCGALVGLAPFHPDSRPRRGTRTIWGGRKTARAVPYMATVAAIRCNPVIKAFYQRLLATGKRPKVALTACMRKLLTILNAMLKHRTAWAFHRP